MILAILDTSLSLSTTLMLHKIYHFSLLSGWVWSAETIRVTSPYELVTSDMSKRVFMGRRFSFLSFLTTYSKIRGPLPAQDGPMRFMEAVNYVKVLYSQKPKIRQTDNNGSSNMWKSCSMLYGSFSVCKLWFLSRFQFIHSGGLAGTKSRDSFIKSMILQMILGSSESEFFDSNKKTLW